MESSSMYKAVLENMSEAVYVRDLDMNLLYINPASERLTGWSMEDAVGKKCYEVFGDENQACSDVCPVNKAISEKRHIVHNEGKLKTRSGEIKDMRVSISPLYEGETVIGGVVVMEDTTRLKEMGKTHVKTLIHLEKQMDERKQAEEALRQSKKFLQDIFDGIQDGISVLDRDLTITQVNRWVEQSHVDHMPVVGKKCYEVYQQRKTPCPWCPTIRSLSTGEVHVEEVQVPLADGSFYWTELSAYPIKDENGDVTGVIEHVKDISNRKRSEEELRNARRDWEGIFQAIGHPTLILDTSHRVVHANAAAEKATGRAVKDLIGKKCHEIFHNSDQAPEGCPFEKMLTTGQLETMEMEIEALNGTFLVSCTPMLDNEGRLEKVIHIATDITERKRAEEALREHALMLEKLLQGAADGICLCHNIPDYPYVKFTHWNPRMTEITGYTLDEINTLGWYQTVYPDPDVQNRAIERTARMRMGDDIKAEEWVITTKDGEERTLSISTSVVTEEDGEVHVLAVMQDITDRSKAQEALRESEERFRKIIENTEAGYFFIDQEGRFREVNEAWLRMHRYSSSDEVIGKHFSLTQVASDLYQAQAMAKKAVSGESVPTGEFSRRCKDGSIAYHTFTLNPVIHGGKSIGLEGFIIDITEKMKLETQLKEAKKMQAIATLAGGIAHQFNNALSSIIGNLDLLEMDHRKDDTLMESLKDMKASGRRMAHLTSQLLAYARGGKYNAQTMSLARFVIDTIPLIEHTLNPDVRVETDLPPDVFAVKADPNQMQMGLSAIVANSNEAIEPPGRIRISLRNIDLDQGSIEDHPGLKPGPHVCLSIEDDGKGMDEETRERIFEPFFTTHFMGRGLGMASVYGMISNHDGSISVDSEPGKGTVVKIYLPALEAKEAVEERIVSAPAIDLPTGEGTVLVIEDEEPLLKMNRQILERFGYRVLEARNGKEAVELAKTFDGQIDLALLDIKLPDMSGNQIYPLIMEARPNLKVVVCSGYSIDGPAREILGAGAQAFIQKPFLISTLAEKLKEVLGGK